MAQAQIRVSKTGKGLHIEIDHPLALTADAAIVEGCVKALLDCATANNCLDKQLRITSGCFEAVAKHEAASKCLSTCFGCA